MITIILKPETMECVNPDIFDSLEITQEYEVRVNKNFVKKYLILKSSFIGAN